VCQMCNMVESTVHGGKQSVYTVLGTKTQDMCPFCEQRLRIGGVRIILNWNQY
jgi:hypothetical protein